VYVVVSSPEIVQSLPYGEKADIWSLGCLLYQMSTLRPPFNSSNMLTLATKVSTSHGVSLFQLLTTAPHHNRFTALFPGSPG